MADCARKTVPHFCVNLWRHSLVTITTDHHGYILCRTYLGCNMKTGQPIWTIIIRSKFFFLFIGREPTTWPANNCLQIMVCSCAMPSNCVWLSPGKNVYACSGKNDTWSISGNVIGSEAKMPAKCCSYERSDGTFFWQWQRCNFLPL